MQNRDYLNLKQACEITGLSNTTLRKAIKDGKLKATRPSWKLCIQRVDLDAFMRASACDAKVG